MDLTPRKLGDYPNVTKEQWGESYEYTNPLEAMDKELEIVGKCLVLVVVIVLVVIMSIVVWRVSK